MKVSDASTGNLIGYLVDISIDGFKLDCDKPLTVGKDYRLYIELSPDIASKTSMIFTAKCVWVQPDNISPNAFKLGFQISSIAPADATIFQRMFEKYAESKPHQEDNRGSFRQ
jgi:hypothetical protein